MLGLLIGITGVPTSEIVFAQQGPRYEVTVTNLTRGQQFTPILVASHKEGVKLFTLGRPASVELEFLAEDGGTGAEADCRARLREEGMSAGRSLMVGESR